MTLLAFLFAIGLLVTVHEWGHYRMAVAFGVKVLNFSIGLGPTLFRWRVAQAQLGHATEFQIGLIPLGGYVRMLDEREAEVTPADLPFAFNRQPLAARAAIVAAGPLANIVLAVVLFALMNGVGRQQTAPVMSAPMTASVAERAGLQSGDVVLRVGRTPEDWSAVESYEALRAWVMAQGPAPLYFEVQRQGKEASRILMLDAVPDANNAQGWTARGLGAPWSAPVLGDVVPNEPAALAGLQRGDQVMRVNQVRVEDAAQLRNLIRLSGNAQEPLEQTWQVSRQGSLLTLDVQPLRIREDEAWIGRVGAQIGAAPDTLWVTYDWPDAIAHALMQTLDNVQTTADMLIQLLTGQAAWQQVGGAFSIADYAGRTAQQGLGVYLGYLAMLSISLGVFNLLPLPVLDGGHLLYYLYEFVTGKSPSEFWLGVMQRLGLALLFTLMIFSLLNDAQRLGWLG